MEKIKEAAEKIDAILKEYNLKIGINQSPMLMPNEAIKPEVITPEVVSPLSDEMSAK